MLIGGYGGGKRYGVKIIDVKTEYWNIEEGMDRNTEKWILLDLGYSIHYHSWVAPSLRVITCGGDDGNSDLISYTLQTKEGM